MAGALPASPSLVICRIWLTGPPSTLVAAKKQSSSCEAFAASASGVAAAIAACCTSRPQPSRRRQRESVSLMPSQPSAKSTTGLGAHGNASPSGSPPHAPLALPLMVAPMGRLREGSREVQRPSRCRGWSCLSRRRLSLASGCLFTAQPQVRRRG